VKSGQQEKEKKISAANPIKNNLNFLQCRIRRVYAKAENVKDEVLG
jgi:hypothetical protein